MFRRMSALKPINQLIAAGSFGCLVLLSAPSATAQSSAPSIAGSWAFETGLYNDDQCRIHGRMSIFPGQSQDEYTCEFTTFETCSYLIGEVEQSCAIKVQGNQAAFVSEITQITRQEPHPYGYAPDDWLLNIVNFNKMTGTLESASRAEVIFTRDSAPTS